MVDHLVELGKAGVEAEADTGSFTRGRAIDAMDVDALQFTGEEFYAQVMGTNPYLVKIWLEIDDGATVADRLRVHCTCPVRAVWCKHVVAVALRIIADPQWATQVPGRTFPPVELTQEQLEKYGGGNSLAARVTMMLTVQRTLDRMGRKEVLGVVDKLRAAHPEIEPTLTAIVEPYMSEPSAGMLAVHDAVEEARYASSVAWSDHQVAKAADRWNVAVNTIASHYDSENAESMLSLLHLVIMDINELACREAVPVDALVEIIERACDLHVRIAEQAEPDPMILRDGLVESYLAPGYIPTDLEKYAPLLGDGGVDKLL